MAGQGFEVVEARTAVRAQRPPAPVTALRPPVRGLADGDGADAIVVRERRYRRSLVAADLVAVGLAGTLAVLVAALDPQPLALVLAPVVVLAAKLYGLYDRDELVIHKTTLDEAPRVAQLAGIHVLAAWALDDLLFAGPLTKPQGLLLFTGLTVLGVLLRALARAVAQRVTPTERCLLIGDAETHRRLHRAMASHRVNGVVIGRLDTANPEGILAPGSDHLTEVVQELDVHRLLIVPSHERPEETLELVRAAKATGVRVSLVPQVLDVVGSAVVFDHLAGMFLLGTRRYGLSRSSRAVKRLFDVAGALVLLALSAPFLVCAALAIRLDSAGPVLFRQQRIGRDGRRFRIYKLRTMARDAEARKDDLRALAAADGLFKLDDDPRITRAGRWLRRTSLDELPQLVNVLLGDMSLVGPRPLVLDEDSAITGHDRYRLQLKPGITGPWQVLGSARVPLGEMVKIDYLYAGCWSLWTDVKLLLRTVPHVVAARGR